MSETYWDWSLGLPWGKLRVTKSDSTWAQPLGRMWESMKEMPTDSLLGSSWEMLEVHLGSLLALDWERMLARHLDQPWVMQWEMKWEKYSASSSEVPLSETLSGSLLEEPLAMTRVKLLEKKERVTSVLFVLCFWLIDGTILC